MRAALNWNLAAGLYALYPSGNNGRLDGDDYRTYDAGAVRSSLYV